MENILLSKHQFVIKYLKRCLKGNTYAYVRRCRAKQYGGVRQKSFSRLHLESFSSENRSGFILTGKTILTLLHPDPNLNLDLNLDQFNNAT